MLLNACSGGPRTRPLVFGLTEEGVGTPAFDLRPDNICTLAWHQIRILSATCWRGGSNHAPALLDCGPCCVLWAVLGENRMVRASAKSRRAQLPIGRNAEAGNPVQSQTRPLATGTTTAQP